MTDGPTGLEKPPHLKPAEAPGTWLAARPAACAAAVLGVLAFIVVAVGQGKLWATPDWRLSLPGFSLTVIAAIASIARKERGAYPLWLLGVGLATASLVLGWFLMLAIVIGATAILMLILHTLM